MSANSDFSTAKIAPAAAACQRTGRRSSMCSQRISTVIAVLVLLVIGCASTNPQVSTLIEYRRSGGIQGLDDHLVINTEGEATLTRRATRSQFNVDSDTMGQLRTVLEATGFLSLQREYLPERPGADLFEYILTYGSHTIRTKDLAVPEVLQSLIQLLNHLSH